MVSRPDLDEVLAWKEGEFKFSGQPIRAIMRQMARWYDVEVEYQGTYGMVAVAADAASSTMTRPMACSERAQVMNTSRNSSARSSENRKSVPSNPEAPPTIIETMASVTSPFRCSRMSLLFILEHAGYGLSATIVCCVKRACDYCRRNSETRQAEQPGDAGRGPGRA